MDKDLRDLANQLFTVATAILEDGTLIGVAGQSAKLVGGASDPPNEPSPPSPVLDVCYLVASLGFLPSYKK